MRSGGCVEQHATKILCFVLVIVFACMCLVVMIV